MKRRDFIALIGSAAVWPIAARAEQGERMRSSSPPRIGYVHPSTIDLGSPVMSILRPVWRQLGYREGETVLLRSAQGDNARLPSLVGELIDLKVDVLIVVGPEAVRVARASTTATPIVALDLETDPVRSGLIRSWAQPGGNVTGLFQDQASLAGKWLELLREVAPRLRRVALVWDPTTGPDQLNAAKTAANVFGLETLVLEVRKSEDHGAALATLGVDPATAAILLGSPILANPPHRFADAALKYKLPTVSFFKPIAKAGGLMTYGADLSVYYPRAVFMAHAIVEGAKVGDVPAQRPDHYALVINVKTAEALGLAMPPTLLATADEVIE